MEAINVFDYEVRARELMEPAFWDYFAGGGADEITLGTNVSDYSRIRLRPRMLIDVRGCETGTTLLGTPVRAPLLVAPTAFHCMAHPEGECATARGAGATGTVLIAATDATRSLEEIAQAASAPLWFQLYLYPTREVALGLVRRAEAAGYKAIVLTVDMPTLSRRERDVRNRLTIPPSAFSRANFADIKRDEHAWTNLTWQDVDWLRSVTALPVLLKGILTAEDARLALEHGVDALIVSNHGGRQLDGVVTGIEALSEIVAAVGGSCEVYMDGGIRRGTDILKALALGARAVLVGRPVLWGLTVAGAAGVQHVLEILQAEFKLAMQLAGCPTIESIKRELVKLPAAFN